MWIALDEVGVDFHMVTVDKWDKSWAFQTLYAVAHPLRRATPQVPLLQIITTNHNGSEEATTTELVLCESLIVSQYVAERFSTAPPQIPLLLPQQPEDRATIRLFQELCGSQFARSYLPLLRSASMEELETHLETFVKGLVDMDIFLRHYRRKNGPYLMGRQFSLAECHMAPFVQRCCAILPTTVDKNDEDDDLTLTMHPLAICDKLGLDCLQTWIHAVLSRPSVLATAPPLLEMEHKRIKFQKRVRRLQQQNDKGVKKGK